MKYFLTSNISEENEMCLNIKNGFTDKLKEALGSKPINCLCISSSPADIKSSEYYGNLDKKKFENSGIAFSEYHIIHNGSYKNFDKLFVNADMIFLTGGHVPTQNKFLHKLNLRSKLEKFNGVVVGLSAGSMNSAELVYAVPEVDGEAKDAKYERFLEGLGLTYKMMVPHYYEGMEEETLDGLNIFEDIMIPDSKRREFYIFPDGTYIYGDGKVEEIYGAYKLIKNGRLQENFL